MQILLAFIFGGALGAVLHLVQRGGPSRGVVLAPMIGALLGGVTWLVFTWLGVTTESPWIWIVSAAVPAAILPFVLAALARTRDAHDAREKVRLRIA